MKIKKARKRSALRFLVRVGVVLLIAAAGMCFVSIRRIDNNAAAPNYRDGDLVFEERWGSGAVFLLVRVRGFDG